MPLAINSPRAGTHIHTQKTGILTSWTKAISSIQAYAWFKNTAWDSNCSEQGHMHSRVKVWLCLMLYHCTIMITHGIMFAASDF